MNKYQEALNRIAKYCNVNTGSMLEDDLKTLQELVERRMYSMSKFNKKGSPGEHLKAFLESVVRDYLISRYGLVDGFTYKYTDEDVDSLVHEMYFDIRDSIVESDIFYEVVEDFVSKHTKEEEEKYE